MTYSESSATRYVLSRSGGLLQGVGRSLDAFITDVAGIAESGVKSRATVLLKQGGVEIHHLNKTETAIYQGEADGLANFIRSNLARNARKNVRLSYSSDRAIVKHIRLPAAAGEVLPAILRNKVESLAPWPLEESLWGYCIASNPPPGEIAVDVGIVSRTNALTAISALHSAGAQVRQLDISPDAEDRKPLSIDFDFDRRMNRVASIVKSGIASLALCAAMVSSFGLYLAFSNDVRNRAIRAEIASVQQSFQGAAAPQTDSILAASNEIYEDKRGTPPFVMVIDALTKAIPDGAWLESIDLRGRKLVVTGRGIDTSRVVEGLEASPAFAKAGFASAIQRDPENGVDLFTVSAELEKSGTKP